jgi:putative transposase
MKLVKQIHIARGHPDWSECDRLCWLSKNLYNAALYTQRQNYQQGLGYISYKNLAKQFAESNQVDFRALPAKVSQQTLKLLDQNYRSFFAALTVYKAHPERFQGCPNPPYYKPKLEGRFVIKYSAQSIHQGALKKGFLVLSQTGIRFETPLKDLNEVRILPLNDQTYRIEIVYETVVAPPVQSDGLAGIDLGVSNLATIVTNTGHKPLILNGNPLKSINQFYNKKLATLKQKLPFSKNKKGENIQQKKSKKIQKLTQKRNDKVKDYLHKASRKVVTHLQQNNVSKIVIGQNKGWKQKINIGSINNQNFVAIPHHRFIEMLTYKCQFVGIEVVSREESYTSKCSFLDREAIRHHAQYQGKRIYRGLFRTSTGETINADVNAAANILKKEVPTAFDAKGIEGVRVSPVKVAA